MNDEDYELLNEYWGALAVTGSLTAYEAALGDPEAYRDYQEAWRLRTERRATLEAKGLLKPKVWP
jgi:hypothetical protein